MKKIHLFIMLLLLCSGAGCTAKIPFLEMFGVRERAGEEQPAAKINPAIVIEDNTIYRNSRVGLRVRGSQPVLLENCELAANGRAGLNLEFHARVRVAGCDIHNNESGGININDADRVIIEDGRIHHNREGGIRIRKSGLSGGRTTTARISGNKIFLNSRGGIETVPDGEALLELTMADNEIYHNRRAGIRVENNTRLRARGNLIHDNGTAGIAAYSSQNPAPLLDIYENRIYFNRGAGIHVHSGSSGEFGISNNWIYNNLRAGIACGLWETPNNDGIELDIIHNTIVANGSNIMGAGIRNDAGGEVIIVNNIIAYNFTTGILTRNCRDASYNLLFANGETSSFDEEKGENLFLIEKAQFSGCSGMRRGDMISRPLFVDPDKYDFSLQDDSPARGAAREIDAPYFADFPRDLGAVMGN